MKSTPTATPCPCGSRLAYAACCQPLHLGGRAASAEALMRARYSAYANGLEGYLLATWVANRRPAQIDLAAPPRAKWIGLEVVRHLPVDADHATVEFIARCRINGRAQRLHEISRFIREDGDWRYIDGDLIEEPPSTACR